MTNLEEYDRKKIEQAKKLLTEVYDYYYGYLPLKSKISRLNTIISKLTFLLDEKINN